MLRMKRVWMAGFVMGLMSLIASPAYARSISFKDAGIALWIFIIIGAVIILLQLIPAAILFFSFIGSGSAMALKKKVGGKEVAEEQKAILPGYNPAPAEK